MNSNSIASQNIFIQLKYSNLKEYHIFGKDNLFSWKTLKKIITTDNQSHLLRHLYGQYYFKSK
jgi:hypothetical protein